LAEEDTMKAAAEVKSQYSVSPLS